MNNRTQPNPDTDCARFDVEDLVTGCGSALLDICQTADRRIGVDDDLDIIRDVTTYVTHLCHDQLDLVHDRKAGSWHYRFSRLAALLLGNSRWAYDMADLDALVDLCERLPAALATSERAARDYARRRRHDWVTGVRVTVLSTVFSHAARLTWGDR